MKLTASHPVPVTADKVRATFADPEALLAGLDVITLTPTGPGTWDIEVEMNGRRETGTLRHVETDGETVRHEALSAGLQVDIIGHCAPAEAATALTVDVEVKAKSMKAKMFLPALSLAQSQIETGLGKALGKLARRMAADHAET